MPFLSLQPRPRAAAAGVVGREEVRKGTPRPPRVKAGSSKEPASRQRRAQRTGRRWLNKCFHFGIWRRADPGGTGALCRAEGPRALPCPFQGVLLTAATWRPRAGAAAPQGGDLLDVERLRSRPPGAGAAPSAVASAQLLLFFLIPFLPLPLPMTPDISEAKFGYKQLACVRELGRWAAAGQGREEQGAAWELARGPCPGGQARPRADSGLGLQAQGGLQGAPPSAPRSPGAARPSAREPSS